MKAVRIPTWISAGGLMHLPATSAAVSRSAPKAMDAGKRTLPSDPIMSRQMCGPTSPTNPIRPVRLTMTAVTRATTARSVPLRRAGSTPMDLANSSPEDTASILLE